MLLYPNREALRIFLQFLFRFLSYGNRIFYAFIASKLICNLFKGDLCGPFLTLSVNTGMTTGVIAAERREHGRLWLFLLGLPVFLSHFDMIGQCRIVFMQLLIKIQQAQRIHLDKFFPSGSRFYCIFQFVIAAQRNILTFVFDVGFPLATLNGNTGITTHCLCAMNLFVE